MPRCTSAARAAAAHSAAPTATPQAPPSRGTRAASLAPSRATTMPRWSCGTTTAAGRRTSGSAR
eukprot:7013681-Prymnesium_polylepis.1